MSVDAANSLLEKIKQLEEENAMLRRGFNDLSGKKTVSVPAGLQPLFDVAQQTVNEYFKHLKMDPTQGTIEINDQRYVLVRASALSKDFLETVQNLYADRGETEALTIGKNFLFDIAHVIGMNDAKNFHEKMNLTDPIAKLSAGTVHFAYSGWAFVDIMPESNPAPNDDFFLIYNHPYSFEADSWKRAGKKATTPVCIMNAGYSSGWCEESFNLPLTAVEVSCTARGDETCTFIMSPPHKIQEHLERFHTGKHFKEREPYAVPSFFDRKRVEEEMQRSRELAEASAKSKSDFIANISHELRTPLGAILGFTDLLKKSNLTEEQRDYVAAVNSSANSLLSIINDILDLSKMDADKFNIEKIPFSIPELLHSVEVMFLSKVKEKNIKFVLNKSAELDIMVEGDPMRLTQVLVNLIGNAVKFTDKGGVYINCFPGKQTATSVEVNFDIKDTGIGINASKSSAVFERFSQADNNITRKYGGTGLGLAITRQLVELQGGQISFTSKEGEGTTFSFNIPYEKTSINEMPVKVTNVSFKATPGQFEKVLVVEDNLMNQKLATLILSGNGFQVSIANNGEEAISMLSKELFDIILMDIQMPVMDGYQCAQFIRQQLRIITPIIAMTAHALPGEKEKCVSAGMNDYISKPYTEAELLSHISRFAKPVNDIETSNDEPLVNLVFLKNQTKNNEKFILEMIGIFLQQNPVDLQTLDTAIHSANYHVIYKTTHTLRNTVVFFGLEKAIGNQLMEMERLARNEEQVEKIAALFSEVKKVCARATKALEQMHATMQV